MKLKLLKTCILFLISSNVALAGKIVIRGNIYSQGPKIGYLSLEKFTFSTQQRKIFQQIHPVEVSKNHQEFSVELDIARPMLMQLFFKDMYFTPGDTINVDYFYKTGIDGHLHDSLAVKAKYPQNFLFYDLLYKNKFATDPATEQKKYIGNWQLYKDDLTNYYDSVEAEIDWKIEGFSQEFLEYVRNDLFFSRLQSLSAPIESGLVNASDLPPNYFADFDKADFNNENLLEQPSYCYSLFLYNTIVNYKGDRNKLDSAQFGLLMNIVNQKYNGEIKGYLMFHISNWFFKKASPDAIRNIKIMLEDQFTKDVKEEYKKLIIENYPFQFTQSKSRLSIDILDTKFKNVSGNPIDLKSILAKQGDRIIYIDFWASWCIPCLHNITESLKSIKQLDSKKFTSFYISIDDDLVKWRKASKQLKIPNERSAVVENKKMRQGVSSYFNIESVPHGILIYNGEVINFNMPHPLSKHLFINEIKSQLQKVENNKPQQNGPPPPPKMLP
ncbi:TlpA family protein disulfide reductase [Ferruginibacter sp.]|nr:thioredoxin family protein [Ferruginibacter sp.]